MKGGLSSACRKACALLAVAVLLLGGFPVKKAAAVGGLELARDTIASFVDSQPNVDHTVYFVLPSSAQQIDPNTWILISFPNYFDLTQPTYMTGQFGTPTYSIVGTTLRITNVAVLAGTPVEIGGITATNPGAGNSNQIIIKIANDSAGTQVRNQATVLPTDGGSFINTSAIVESDLSALSITGFTGPDAFTSLTENGTVLGTTNADGTGFFRFSSTGLDPGDHSYRIYSTDSQNRSTAQTALNLFLLAGNLTTVTGILLSSTLQLDQAEINPGDTLVISGSSKPNSQINIFLEAPLRSYTANSDNNGDWSYTVPASETSGFAPGQYQVYTVVQDGIGNQSIVSNTLTFTVKTPDSNNPPPDCDISHGDLSCDGHTNLTDFSILLYHWHTNHKVADINNDGQVDLIDFSVMMFYYGQ